MVEHQLPKLDTRVRFPSPAPIKKTPSGSRVFFIFKIGNRTRKGIER